MPRGRKPLDRALKAFRLADGTNEKLKVLAIELGYVYGGDGATGALLDAIAEAQVVGQVNGDVLIKVKRKSNG
jgi:hypothetical protein